MENDKENGRIGCKGGEGRTKIIDPNDFNGFNSSTNISVPLEDLNISVKLTTKKKPRTVLTTTEKESTAVSTRKVTINFISGTDVEDANGTHQKMLTTKYTDLTTVFEKGTLNSETLGITNIDIDFNTSYAPQVTINLIDVRGSSIFQNESGIASENSVNPYATLFTMPYPIFELEIKGYYGKPVTYCLHMLKFNTKFNSQTGNFEMQCEFVGYTYAMLSDLLVGYLKVISLTTIGKDKYALYNSNKDNTKALPVLTLHELVIKLQSLNEGLEKEAGDSANSVGSANCDKGATYLTNIEEAINTFGNIITDKLKAADVDIPKFSYIPIKSTDEIPKIAVTEYNKSIDEAVKLFNELNLGTTLNVTDFKILTIYSNVKQSWFNENITTNDNNLKAKVGGDGPENLLKFKRDIFSFLGKFSIGDTEINLYNMTKLFDKTTELKTLLVTKNQDFKKSLATELSDKVTAQLNFSPTVRNVIEIFSAAAEVFMETIYQVSTNAETDTSGKRKAQLKSKFKFLKSTDLPSIAEDSTYFAWPDFKEIDKDGRYIEKYLGDPAVGLEHPEDVDELVFIENLFKAFIIAAQEEANAQRDLDNQTKLWLPINPTDTKLFSATEPYGRAEVISYLDIARLAVIRGMTFLGYTNDGNTLTQKEIIAMGEAEADNILRSVDNKVLQTFIPKITDVNTASTGTTPTVGYSKTLDLYLGVTGKINGSETKVIIPETTKTGYFYNYIYDVTLPDFTTSNNKNNNFDVTKKESYINITTPIESNKYKSIIPINDRFQGDWPKTNGELLNLHNNEGLVFLTNYSSIYKTPKIKIDDGGTYIKIFNISEFQEVSGSILLNELPQNATTDNILKLKQLELPKSKIANTPETTGFNALGGPMGIQEYLTVKDETGDVQLMNIFYSNDFEKQPTGLANSRNITLPAKFKDGTTKYDIKTSLPRKFGTQKDYYKTSNSDKAQILHSSQGHNRNFLNFKDNIDNLFVNVSYPYFEQPIFDYNLFKIVGPVRKSFDNSSFSLFGSKLYYAQTTDYAKAFLFLNNLPFNKGVETASPFENNEIINLFNMRGGFIHAPMLWCAWVGSILWRRDESALLPENGRLIGGGNGKGEANDPIKWFFNGISAPKDEYADGTTTKFNSHPSRNQYLTCVNVNAPNLDINFSSIRQDDILANLPFQVEYEFKRIFFDFVKIDGGLSEWDILRDSLEIWSSTSASFNDYVNRFNKLVSNSVEDGTFNFSEPTTTNLKNKENYSIIAPVVYPGGLYRFNDYLFLELSKNGKDNVAVGNLISAMRNEVVIANTGYEIWQDPFDENNKLRTGFDHKLIFVKNENFNLYFKSLNNKLVASGVGMGEVEKKKEIINTLFGTTNESIIKLSLYKHCKNIYDKWIGGTTDIKDLMFQCGVSKRNSTDGGLALKYGNKSARFIDSFRFVNRTFRDIGDLLYINPIPINDFLTENQNASMYNAVTSVLSSNNFDFIALPTFINFRDDEELKAVFKPYGNYGQVIKDGSCGPTFVCVYSGEKSKHLAIIDSQYPNDGFDLRCVNTPTTASDVNNATKKTGTLPSSIPNDFIGKTTDGSNPENNTNQFEDPISVFTVKYSQQNQNIFKDISLDQSEFTETEESIKIMDDIAQKGAETNRTLVGQNLYGVNSVRSYKAEIEMLGNAMIQPMMYFQLDNIPMFHGAYMIIRVKHSIKPNYMSTNFTGVRIKYSETALITASDVYMSLIDTLDLSAAVDTSLGNVRGNGLSAADLANIKTVKCNAITKTDVAFIEVLRAVVAYLEGNYCRGGTACGDKANNIRSGETLWGLDRKNHQGKLDNAFWTKADSYNKGKWGQRYPTPFTEETKPLFELYTPIFKKEYDSFSKRYFTNPAVKALVESDGRLFFNLVYTVYNGQAYFKGMVKLMESEYNKGKKTADSLLQSVINDRVSGLQQTFFLGTNHKLGQDGVTKLARTGIKIEKLVGLATSCK